MKPWIAIVNSAAGGGAAKRRAPKALNALRSAGFDIETHATLRPGHATAIARRAWAEGYRRFLSIGGDGTTYEVVNGLFPVEGEGRPRLGILPLGTGNSFLRDFGITSADQALRAVLSRQARRIDVVRVDHADGVLHYVNLLSVGFSARVGDLTNRRFKRLGMAGYAVAVALSVARLEPERFALRADGAAETDAHPCTLLSFSNSRFTGGTMQMAPNADPSDGALDVIRIDPVDRGTLLRALPRLYKGTHVDLPVVSEARAREIHFEPAPPVPIMVDGEIIHAALRRLEVLPGALEVLA